MLRFVEAERGDPRRGERLGDELVLALVPAHDVDLLPVKLVHDGLNAGAFHADARSHGVDLVVARMDGDLRSAARLAGDVLDLDVAVEYLGNLLLEQLAEKLLARPGKGDLRPLRVLVHLDDDGPDRVSLVVPLLADLLAERQVRFGAAEVHENVAAVDLAHGAGDDDPHLVLVFLVDAVALGLADLLHENLLGRLHGVAAELVEGDVHLDLAARLRSLVDRLGVGERQLRRGLGDLVDDPEEAVYLEHPLRFIEDDAKLGVLPVLAFARRNEARLDHLDERALLNFFLAYDLRECFHEAAVHRILLPCRLISAL